MNTKELITLADESTVSYADLLYELRGPLQELFPKKHVMSAELKRDTSMENFSGNQVRVPLILNTMQGGGAVSETGTVNTPQNLRTNQAHINIAELVFPISISKRLRNASLDNSAAKAVALKVKEARLGLARLENEMYNGDGTAKLGDVTSATGSPGLTIPVGTGVAGTGINSRYFYPGRIVDIRTKSNGADPGQGLKRRIASVTKTNGIVTAIVLDTNTFGGGTGNVTFSANEGVYIDGSYGNAIQGIQQIGGTTGVFETIDRSVITEFQGTDGRASDPSPATVKLLTLPMLEAALAELGARTDEDIWDFGIGDPRVINGFVQGLYTQTRWAGEKATLESGFEGVAFEGKPLVKEFDHQVQAMSFIHKDGLQMYGFGDNLPDFDNDTGSIFQRFNRTLPAEAWLYDAVQLGALRCDTTVRVQNLQQA